MEEFIENLPKKIVIYPIDEAETGNESEIHDGPRGRRNSNELYKQPAQRPDL